MQNSTGKAGPQPPACVLDDCASPPWNGMVGEYCKAHKEWFDRQNGTAVTPPILEADDPDLIEREQRKAREAEEREYRDRRRVKSWKTLEDGRRVPDELYSDEEFAAIEAEARQMAELMARRLTPGPGGGIAGHYEDPTKARAKLFRRALQGKLGDRAQRTAEFALDAIEALRE